MKPLFRLSQASVHFGRPANAVRALTDVSMCIEPGEHVALVGANGCGKSTLLRLLHGLVEPTAGQRMVDAAVRQAMLFQRPYLMRLTVQANIALSLWLQGTPWRQANAVALVALDRVGLTPLARRNACQLSGGQQQRVALARAWALRPQVLLLDEPTASLDPHAKREVETLIETFTGAASGLTVVFASHNLGQVKRLASRVIYLEQGRVLADLPVARFFGGTLLQRDYPAAHRFVRGELA